MKCDRCGCELVKFTGVDYTASIKWHDEEIIDRKLFTLCIVRKDIQNEILKMAIRKGKPIVPRTVFNKPLKHKLCDACCKELEEQLIHTVKEFVGCKK